MVALDGVAAFKKQPALSGALEIFQLVTDIQTESGGLATAHGAIGAKQGVQGTVQSTGLVYFFRLCRFKKHGQQSVVNRVQQTFQRFTAAVYPQLDGVVTAQFFKTELDVGA